MSRTQDKRPAKRKAPRKRAQVVEAELVEESAALVVQPPSGDLARSIPEADIMRQWLAAQGEITARNYLSDLRCFAKFTGSPSIENAVSGLMRMTGPEANYLVLQYKTYLSKTGNNGKPYSAATINRRLAALKSVLKLARTIGKIDWHIEIDGAKARKKRDTSGPGITGFRQLMQQAETDLEHAVEHGSEHQVARATRDRTLLALYYYAGLRRFEPLTIQFPKGLRTREEHDEDAGGLVTVYEARIVGKTRAGEYEWVPIGATAWRMVEAWLEVRGDKAGPLFPGRNGKSSLRPGSVNKAFAGLAERAQVETTPHGLRHTAITRVLDKSNGNLPEAQQFARHSNMSTTMIYDDNRQNRARKATARLEDD